MKLAECGGPYRAIEFVVERLSWIDSDPHDQADPSTVLVAGWDYAAHRSSVDPATLGIWRSPQFVPSSSDSRWQIGKPILAMDMTIDQIAAGLWRQLKIIPLAAAERAPAGSVDPFKDAYGRIGSRDRLLEPFLGVSVRAMAMFVDDLRRSDPQMAHALLSKNFLSVGKSVNQLAAIRWPDPCLALFQQEGRKTVIPPALAFVLHASLAQFAQSHAAHLSLSFADDKEITPKVLIGMLRNATGDSLSVPARYVSEAAELQTLTWMGSNSEEAVTVSTRSLLLSSAYGALANNGGRTGIAHVPIATHPGSFARRAGHTSVLAHRGAITRFGLAWRDSSALNLLIVNKQMKAWHDEFGHSVRRKKDATQLGWRPGSLPEAMSRVGHFWLETIVPDAAAAELFRMANASGDHLGQPIESVGGKDVGRQVLARARYLESIFDRSDAIGYSALAHPSLWLQTVPSDQPEFNLLGRAARRDLKSIRIQHGIPESVVKGMSLDGLRTARQARSRRTFRSPSDREVEFASLVAQALSMMMHVQAADPMHSALLAQPIKNSPAVQQGS